MNSNVPNVNKLGALADGKSTYERWAEEQEVPIVKAFFIQNLNQVVLGPWERKGGRGAIINLEGTGDTDDAYICEIASGGKSSPERHVYEELVYVLEGRGATTIWQEAGAKQTFEWQPGKSVCDSAQRVVPALQRQRASVGALHCIYLRAAHDEPTE
jgi:hypothetical protein